MKQLCQPCHKAVGNDPDTDVKGKRRNKFSVQQAFYGNDCGNNFSDGRKKGKSQCRQKAHLQKDKKYQGKAYHACKAGIVDIDAVKSILGKNRRLAKSVSAAEG